MTKLVTDILPPEGSELVLETRKSIARNPLSESIKNLKDFVEKSRISEKTNTHRVPYGFPANYPLRPQDILRHLRLMERDLRAVTTRTESLIGGLDGLTENLSGLLTRDLVLKYNSLQQRFQQLLASSYSKTFPGMDLYRVPTHSMLGGTAHLTQSGEIVLPIKSMERYEVIDAELREIRGMEVEKMVMSPGFLFFVHKEETEGFSLKPVLRLKLDFEKLINYIWTDSLFPHPGAVTRVIVRDSSGRMTRNIDTSKMTSYKGLELHFAPARCSYIDFCFDEVKPLLTQWDLKEIEDSLSFYNTLKELFDHQVLKLDTHALAKRLSVLLDRQETNSDLHYLAMYGFTNVECGLITYENEGVAEFKIPVGKSPRMLILRGETVHQLFTHDTNDADSEMPNFKIWNSVSLVAPLLGATDIKYTCSFTFQKDTAEEHIFKDIVIQDTSYGHVPLGYHFEMLTKPRNTLDGQWIFDLVMPCRQSTTDPVLIYLSITGYPQVLPYSYEQIEGRSTIFAKHLLGNQYCVLYQTDTSLKGENKQGKNQKFFYSGSGALVLDPSISQDINEITMSVKLERAQFKKYITPRFKGMTLVLGGGK